MVAHSVSRWFTVDLIGEVTIVRFAHARILDDEAVDQVRTQLFDLVEREGRRLFVLNFAAVTGLASRMLGQLVVFHEKLQRLGGRLALCHVSPFLGEFFETANLPGLLCIRGGEDEALRAVATLD
jgi:anti-anti-sigma factor